VDTESESSSIQNDIDNIKADMNNRLNQLLSMVSDLKTATQAAAFQNLTTATIADNRIANSASSTASSSSQSVILTDNLTENSQNLI
jgi:hypothetical protein